MKFISWLPNLNGRVSFRRFGRDSESSSGRYYMSTNHSMYVYFFGNIYCSDALFKTPLTDFLFTKSGYLFYQVFAISNSSAGNANEPVSDGFYSREKISGQIFIRAGTHIVPRLFGLAKPGEYEDREASELNFKAIDFIARRAINARKSSLIDKDVEQITTLLDIQMIKLKSRIESIFTPSMGKFVINFELLKNGEIELTVPETTELVDNKTANHYIRTLDRDTKSSLAIVAFNILRNKAHSHKHHSNSNDSIIGVYPYHAQDKRSWIFRVVSSLREKMRSLHNLADEQSQAMALGMDAYLSTFGELFLTEREKEQLRVSMNINAIKSYGARKSKIEIERSFKAHLQAVYFTFLASLVAAVTIVPPNYKNYKYFDISLEIFLFWILVGFLAYSIAKYVKLALYRTIRSRFLMFVLRFGRGGLNTARAISTIGFVFFLYLLVLAV